MAGRAAGRSGRRTLATVVGGALLAGAAVVAVDVAVAPSAQAAALEAFGSCEELTAWYRDSAAATVTAWGDGGGPGWGGDVVAGADVDAGVAVAESGEVRAAADGAASTGGPVGSSDTGTNVQEDGVEEPARVKLRDGLAWTLAGSRLVAVDTGSGRVVGGVELAAGGPAEERPGGYAEEWFSELLLVDDRVVVLGSGALPSAAPDGSTWGTGGSTAGMSLPWHASTTTATTVAVGDPTAMTVLDRVEVEGDYVSARASAGVIRLVTSHRPLLPYVDPWLLRSGGAGSETFLGPEPGPADEAQALRRNREVLAAAGPSDWLPDVVRRGADGQVEARTTVDCASVSHPAEPAGTGTLSVLTLDPTAPDTLTGTTAVAADGSTVYASTDRLYVATTRGGWTWGGRDGSATTTELHGFDTTGRAGTAYTGSGSVAGWLLGSWALDADDGHLRVGTTSEAGGTSSSVVVLQETTAGLVEVGRVDGLGPGEQIRSLRWFDDLAVVVTFRQTDPLYTVDLSDPTAPEVLGELKVTGYSGYLHPVGDGLLLGVGQDGDEAGRLLGAKVETYDVRDLTAPTDVDTIAWPGSSSPVEWDSRLFAYLPGSRTAVLPLERYDADGYATGMVAVAVAPDGTVRETGSWLGRDGGSVGGVATGEGVVVVTSERWALAGDGTTDAEATTVLTVLSTADLTVRAEVPLG